MGANQVRSLCLRIHKFFQMFCAARVRRAPKAVSRGASHPNPVDSLCCSTGSQVILEWIAISSLGVSLGIEFNLTCYPDKLDFEEQLLKAQGFLARSHFGFIVISQSAGNVRSRHAKFFWIGSFGTARRLSGAMIEQLSKAVS